MAKYNILDGETVINTIVAELDFMRATYPEGNYEEVVETVPAPLYTVYEVEPYEVSKDGAPLPVLIGGDYDADLNDTVQVQTQLIGGEVVDYGEATLKVPLVRYANNEPTQNEMYFRATIIAGVMTTYGQLPYAGDWRITTERTNLALGRIDADWRLADNTPDVCFLV